MMKKKKKSGVDTAFLSLIPHGFGFSPGWVEISGIMVGQKKQQWVFCFFSKHPLLQRSSKILPVTTTTHFDDAEKDLQKVS